jgi:hypothetical protein
MTRDEEGHREYKIKHHVRCAAGDGPAIALATSGLPQPGDTWNFDNDSDSWATCKQNATVTPTVSDEVSRHFEVEQTFSSKGDEKRCKDQQIEDPLLEPQKVSGSFVKYQEEAVKDKDDELIKNPAFESFKGPQIEFDKNRPSVRIEQNVSSLQLATCSQMVDRVNDSTLWGLAARCVKLSNFSWEKKFYGACYAYYTRIFEFDIRFDTFDRDVLNEGTKALNGHWEDGVWTLDNIGGSPPSSSNPRHFIRVKDAAGENMTVLLSSTGVPLTDGGNPTYTHVEYYKEANFLTLSIPTTF